MKIDERIAAKLKLKALELVLVELCGVLLPEHPDRIEKLRNSIGRAVRNEAVVRGLDGNEEKYLLAWTEAIALTRVEKPWRNPPRRRQTRRDRARLKLVQNPSTQRE